MCWVANQALTFTCIYTGRHDAQTLQLHMYASTTARRELMMYGAALLLQQRNCNPKNHTCKLIWVEQELNLWFPVF